MGISWAASMGSKWLLVVLRGSVQWSVCSTDDRYYDDVRYGWLSFDGQPVVGFNHVCYNASPLS